MSNIIKVLAVTSGFNTPSSRFRIRQNIEKLNQLGLSVDELCPVIDKNASVPFLAKISPKYYIPIYAFWQLLKVIQRMPILIKQRRYDYIWLNRELVTGYLTLEPLLSKKIILDVDDAIWKNPPFGEYAAIKIAKMAHGVVCGNEYLAEWFQRYNSNVVVVPTSVDIDKFKPKKNILDKKDEIVIGWVGTHGNLKYVDGISHVLIDILKQFPFVKLMIVSDKEPKFSSLHHNISYVEWSAASEVENFQSIDVGIMPLCDDEWTKGKCSYKLLQHMACGSLVVGSPVGMNKNVLRDELNGAFSADSPEQWKSILSKIVINYNEIHPRFSELAREYIITNYSSDVICNNIAKVFFDD
ncbi:MAG: glycosyltransferase family 4 protein [Plesiomonas shigelloides]